MTPPVVPVSASVAPSPEADLAAVRELARGWIAAYKACDTSWLEQNFADDFTLILPNGGTRTKALAIVGLQKQKPNIDVWEVPEEDRVFRVGGDMAVDTGTEHIVQHDMDGKSSEDRFRYTTVYVRRDGRWLALVNHLTPIPVSVASAPLPVADNPEVMAPVHQFLDGFNKGDMKSAVAACASPASVVDQIPPHAWQGPKACADWWRAFDANTKATGITEPLIKIKSVNALAVTADRAYVVATASYDWKQNGSPMKQEASKWTFALQKQAAGWRITGWTWSQ